MKTIMNDTQIKTLEQVRQFLEGTGAVDLTIDAKEDRYAWIQHTLIRFRYRQLGKADKGLLLGFLQKVCGYSRIQIKRLVKQSIKTGKLKRRQRTVNGFTRTYTREDIRLLAHTDELHGTLSGPATKKLCERAWVVFGQAEYERLAGISVGHLYNLRHGTPTTPCGVTSRRHAPPSPASANVVHPGPRASRVTCAWIRYTRVI